MSSVSDGSLPLGDPPVVEHPTPNGVTDIAQRVKHAYPLPYGPKEGQPMATNPCAHEFIAVPRAIIDRGVTIMDIAKNLIDRGFHPPTVHWPVHDCLMIEPTETESKATLDAFADALLDIARKSESDIEQLKQAPLSGSLFACRPGMRGLAESRFAG